MTFTRTLIALALTGICLPALADQTDMIQRNVNQQERIEQGLKSGELNTREAGRLEHEQAAVEKMETRSLHDGTITPAEQARIDKAQNKVSRDIYQEKHNARKGNPDSASSQRMQADVQRNVNQQQRIEQGVKSGQLTDRETARLERGEARINRTEARAARDGHVGAHEQRVVQRKENRESKRIFNEKHDPQKTAE